MNRKKRTKTDKIKSRQRRIEHLMVSPVFGDSVLETSEVKTEAQTSKARESLKKSNKQLLDFDAGLIAFDLRKTIILSILLFAVEIGLYWILR